jgi:transcriptional regulator with XRE-family HTH domain
MSIGDQLRNARRAKGVTIEHIASVTKISPNILRALETDDLAKLPGWVFTRGFLKSYAREVDLDPDETVATFLAQIAPPEEPSAEESRETRSARHLEEIHEPIEFEHSTDLGQMIAVAVIVIAAVAYLGLHNRATSTLASASAPTVVSTSAVAAPTDVPVATAGFTAPKPVASETADLKIDLAATGPCWVSATVDAEPPIQRLMNAGEHETVTARDGVTLRVGDPAAFHLSINGVPGRSLGEAGRPVTVHITPQNAREFLAR